MNREQVPGLARVRRVEGAGKVEPMLGRMARSHPSRFAFPP